MEQRQALGTRLVAATTVVVVFFALIAVTQPARATITSVSPGSATVEAGQSVSVVVNLSTAGSCLSVTGLAGSITAQMSMTCGGPEGAWTSVVTLTADPDAQARTYSLRFKESPPLGSSAGSDNIEFSLTVLEPPPTTTTVPAPTTTTVPGPDTPPPTEPPTTTTTTSPPAPPPPPTTTTVPPTTTTTPPTTVLPPDDTSTTTTDVSPTSTVTTLPTNPLAVGAPPPSTNAAPTTTTTLGAVGESEDLASGMPVVLGPNEETQDGSILSGGLAQAIPRSLGDLVVSPFVIIGVILQAIGDTGAVSIWAMLLALPIIIDWRRMRRRFQTPASVSS